MAGTMHTPDHATGAAVRELLGAINYLAGAVIWLESHRGNPEA